MAVTPTNNEAFLREVDEELRRDRIAGFGRRWGIAIVVAIVAGLAAFGGWIYWQHHRDEQAGLQGEKLQAAYDSLAAEQPAAAQKPLAELAASGSDGYRALALFTQGDILLHKNDLKGAAAKFAAIAGDASIAQPFRDLATVRQASAEFDTAKPQAIVERLRPLAVKGNPWFGPAGELTAAAYLRMGRTDLAQRLFAQIAADKDVPETLRQRAVQIAGLGDDAGAQSEDIKAQ